MKDCAVQRSAAQCSVGYLSGQMPFGLACSITIHGIVAVWLGLAELNLRVTHLGDDLLIVIVNNAFSR